MLVFRSITVGLLGACVYMLAGLHMPEPEPVIVESPPVVIAPSNQVTVIDVAPSVPATTVASLVRLHPGERIVAVNDHPMTNDLEAGMLIGDSLLLGSKLLDLTVSGEGAGVRRVLVIVH
jgi:hypothetical protein